MTKSKRKPRRSPRGPGYTISQFAQLPEVDVTEHVIRTAVTNGQLAVIEFNGVKRIPPREREKWQEIWGTQKQGA